ncbi:MAG TPA: malectin domain-containing carbohydrate-binding protein [Steroidobacteraceae bacterium]|jgi:hypothetical protein|nr:malectin domain-containing carbohydrate-binding protein [Steroidobacteraceae bacterium]
MTSRDAERQELERAIEQLGRSTRHGRLLEFLGTKYFSQQEAQLTEFDIAREVFGRSLDSFDPAEDAVVRVEVHRLRKKLRDIYEKDARAHGVQISLPAGTYVPKFTAVGAPEERRRRLPWAWIVAGVGAVAIVVMFIAMGSRERTTQAPGAAATSAPAAVSPGAPGQIDELHIMSGYSGGEVIDNSGTRWTPDQYFAKGGTWSREGGFVRGTSRQFLFKNWRTGEFGYDIPTAPGSYELRLFFVSGQSPGEEKLASFGISLNGRSLLSAYDASMSANGPDVADEQVFRDVRPGADGFVRLWFTNETSTPSVSALELVPGTPGKLKPIRILTQRTSFVDHKGQRWRADDYYQQGFLSTDRSKVSGTDDPELFSAERFGHFSYAIPVDRRGRYTVVLHFAEFYYGPGLPGGGGAGSRIFHVFCNGQTLLRDFDIHKEAGSLRVVTKSFPHIQPSAYGKINLTFEPVINNATVSGIEILDESGS